MERFDQNLPGGFGSEAFYPERPEHCTRNRRQENQTDAGAESPRPCQVPGWRIPGALLRLYPHRRLQAFSTRALSAPEKAGRHIERSRRRRGHEPDFLAAPLDGAEESAGMNKSESSVNGMRQSRNQTIDSAMD